MAAQRSSQRGDILVTALIVMGVATLLVLPLLHLVLTRYRVTAAIESIVYHQYAQDAGVEYALWKIETDDAFRQTLLNNPGTVYTLTVPAEVNGVTPVVEVVRNQPALWEYSIWVSDTFTINANNTEIYGNVHSNGDIYDNKNNTVISGSVTYVGYCSNTPALAHAQKVDPQPFFQPFTIEQFRPGGEWAQKAAAEGKYFQYSSLTVSRYLAPGLYYVTRNVQFTDANEVVTGVTIVAEGTISLNQTANKVTFKDPYVPNLLFFSNSTSSKAIFIDGNKETFMEGGLVYAPRGTIEISGNSLTTAGFFFAKSMVVSKNNLTVDNRLMAPATGLNLGLSPPIYDVRATTPRGRTVARLSQGEAEDELDVVAWYLE